MMEGERMRFRVKRGDLEVEVEGPAEYVKGKFESMLESILKKPGEPVLEVVQEFPETLKGVMEKTSEGRPYISVPVELLTSKEALALFLYALRPKRLSDQELSEIITSGWKTMKAEAVRARASELRRDGKLVSEDGLYTLSGAGVQWVENEVLNKIKQGATQSLEEA